MPADATIDLGRLPDPGSHRDRWSDPGRRTVYLGSDPGVVLAELGRHHRDGAEERRVLRIRLRVDGLVDVRDPAVRRWLGVDGGPEVFRDREVAKRVGARLRSELAYAGIVAPSMAFLDDLDRHAIVLFDEALPGGFAAVAGEPEVVGRVRLCP